MGRRGLSRAIKRVSIPLEALQRYVHAWRFEDELALAGHALPDITSLSLFGDEAPLELEVGCGTGEFLCGLAARHPERRFIGLDPSTQSLNFAARLAFEADLKNLRLIRAPIIALYPHFVPNALDAAYIHFPDPYVRSRQIHKVVNASVLKHLAQAMRPGGTLSFVSDHEALFQEALRLVEAAATDWERLHEERFLRGFTPDVKSRYQLKWERYGVEAFRFEVRRRKV
ncbi:MAG: methyltransferase domain-containing protein [Myxococcales bacterium]|jgi:tRNA (guanine-N7-)-methyltransferase|nr:methyltransferase domain-containing protein [Myxococcales bacterium]